MDGQPSDPEKSPLPDKDIETVAVRTVAFPEDGILSSDEKLRPAGVEMKRHLTQEEIRLAAAGYEHLKKNKSGEDGSKFGNVDITEHSLPIHEIEGLLHTSFNWADPAQSRGLSVTEAEARLHRDGPNTLTPPKKKSALQKVSLYARRVSLSDYATVHRLSEVHVQHHSDHLWYSRVHHSWYRLSREPLCPLLLFGFADVFPHRITHRTRISVEFSSESLLSMHSSNLANCRSPRQSLRPSSP
jgi:hypothetical protein